MKIQMRRLIREPSHLDFHCLQMCVQIYLASKFYRLYPSSYLNPYMLSRSYKIDQSIFVVRVVGFCLNYSSLNITFNLQANSGDSDQMPRSVASGLGLHCLPMSRKKNARLVLYLLCGYQCSASYSRTTKCLWSVIVEFPCHNQMCFRNVFL